MEDAQNLGIPAIVLGSLIYLMISFIAYMISIKGIYDIFPNVLKAFGAFMAELVVYAVLCGLLYALLQSGMIYWPETPQDLSYEIFAIFALFLIITVIVRKVAITYATDVSTSALQAVTSLVMHAFYVWVISFSILLLLMRFFPDSIDPSIFERSS